MPASPSSRPVVAAIALVDDLRRPTRLLAARRSSPPALAGRWEFPGGKVEPGESGPDAACREALEELGVRVRLGGRVGGVWPLGDRYDLHLWWAQLPPGEPDPAPLEDHDELRWLSREELWEVDWLPHDRPVVEHLVPLLHTGAPPRT